MADLSDDQLRQLCAALGWQGGTFWQVLEAVKPRGWQPMSSAPKDGTAAWPLGVPAAPATHVLVPRDPTPAMHKVMLDFGTKRGEWEAILDAAGVQVDGGSDAS